MHELGVVMEVIRTVDRFARQNGVSKVDTIVLQIGELSSVVPQFIEACYPAAVDGTPYENTRLKIERLPANALCKGCHQVFNVIEHRSGCPHCQSEEWGLLGGREFMIKEIVAC